MIKDPKALINKITEEIKKATDFAVVGLSGGVDSLCVATLCTLALGKENVLTVHMPHNEMDVYDELRFNGNSQRIAAKLGTEQRYVPIGAMTETYIAFMQKAMEMPMSQVNKGNARSRMRMCVLYGMTHHLNETLGKRVRVMGTGNLSEDFIGYDTKGGDALADIFPIGELFKSEVYQLAEYFAAEGIIDKDMIDYKPSAGLWDGQLDEEELGYSYNDMEKSIRKIIDSNWPKENWTEIDEFVWNRHFANKHKHEAPPVIKLRGLSFME